MASGLQTLVDIHPIELEDVLTIDDVERQQLSRWIETELNRAKGARSQLERMWRNTLRLYEGVPRRRRRSMPIENASNLVLTIGAIASDSVYAQILNAMFSVDPLLTVRAVSESGTLTEHVKAMQRFVDVVSQKIDLRQAAENAILDNVQMGTGILYTRWAEKRKKTKIDQVVQRGPMVRSIPVEDFFVPGGAYDDLQNERWVAMRYFLTQHEMNLMARDFDWDIEGIRESSNVDMVRTMRERIGRHDGQGTRRNDTSQAGGRLYEIYDIYCLWDIDGDGLDEDLLVTYDKGSRNIIAIGYNPYDMRPFEKMVYQKRSHLFWGLGVIEMLRPFQEGATNQYNNAIDNSQLANARFWAGKHGAVPDNEFRIFPNKFLPLSDPRNDLVALPMADIYPSAFQNLQQTVQFAERRVGVSAITGQQQGGQLGARTPGITAMQILQKSQERFGPAFDSVRQSVAGTVRQAIFRYREQVLADNQGAIADIHMMMEDRGDLVIQLLMDPRMDDTISIELTASNARVNRDTEQQNWILIGQQLITVSERQLQLAMLIDNPEVGETTKNVAMQLARTGAELVDRIMRSFDQVRDPRGLIVDLDRAVAEVEAAQPPDELQNIAALIGQGLDQVGAQQNGGSVFGLDQVAQQPSGGFEGF